MYEEDQQQVLGLYGELYNEAADEEALSSFLGSPTRQAVALARAYNSKERKLQINSSSRADELSEYEDGEESPAFVQIIEQLRKEAEEHGLLSGKPERRSVWSDAPADLDPEIPFIPSIGAEPDFFPKDPVDDSLEYVEPDEAELRFDDLPPMPTDGMEEEEPEEVVPVPVGRRRREEAEPERKLIVPLVILFAIIAIPVTLLLACILLIPTFASLGISAACLFVGVKLAMAAFVGFSMFSDIMVVLGCGVIFLALGLLFLWLFIWFIGGAIAGLIDAVIKLGGKWCSKEVAK